MQLRKRRQLTTSDEKQLQALERLRQGRYRPKRLKKNSPKEKWEEESFSCSSLEDVGSRYASDEDFIDDDPELEEESSSSSSSSSEDEEEGKEDDDEDEPASEKGDEGESDVLGHQILLFKQMERDREDNQAQAAARHKGRGVGGDPREQAYQLVEAILDKLMHPWKRFLCDKALWTHHWTRGFGKETAAINNPQVNLLKLARGHLTMVKHDPADIAAFCNVCNRRCNKPTCDCAFSTAYDAENLSGRYPPKDLLASLQELRLARRVNTVHPQRVPAASFCSVRLEQLHWEYHFNARLLLATADYLDNNHPPRTVTETETSICHILRTVRYTYDGPPMPHFEFLLENVL